MKKTYFNHDSNSRNDLRIIKLRAKLGYEGYGIFWSVLELLFTEENKLCLDDYTEIAFGLQCDPEKLKQVIEDFDLFVLDGGCFYSRRLHHHIEKINSKSEIAKENAKKRWSGKAVALESHTNGNASNSKSNSNSKSKSKSNNIEERRIAFRDATHSINGISDEDKNDFFLYWTEKNKSGTKFRAELEKTFSISLRLKRWANNGFNKQKSKFPDYYNEHPYKNLDSETRREYEEHLKALGYMCKYSPSAGMVWNKIKK